MPSVTHRAATGQRGLIEINVGCGTIPLSNASWKRLPALTEHWSDGGVILAAGLVTGLVFGASAERSRFCLRAATVEFWRGKPGDRFATWLLVFSAALILTQMAALSRHARRNDHSPAYPRQARCPARSSVGALFGIGMVLARGCASRLLVLSATGNLRALVTGLVLTIAAQASLTGILSPARDALSNLWLVERRDPQPWGQPALWHRSGPWHSASRFGHSACHRQPSQAHRRAAFSLATGGAVALGWALTARIAEWSFEPVTVQSVTFTGPSANTLMALINETSLPLTFGTGLVPGVFLGAMAAAILGGDWKLQTFDASSGMIRYMVGAVLMGFRRHARRAVVP